RLILTFLLLGSLTTLQATPALKVFPEPENGMTRHILTLEKQAQEEDIRIELIFGKTVQTDGSNRHFFGGSPETRTMDGWGYSYHILPALGPMASTLMAPRPGSEKVEKFVRVGGNPFWIRYNSQLPVVVYAPEDVEVRYRIWRTKGPGTEIPQG
ncbi:MAG: ecotin family protein, partial [Verrucomicrobiales bacterium]